MKSILIHSREADSVQQVDWSLLLLRGPLSRSALSNLVFLRICFLFEYECRYVNPSGRSSGVPVQEPFLGQVP